MYFCLFVYLFLLTSETESADQRLIVLLNGLEYHVYNRYCSHKADQLTVYINYTFYTKAREDSGQSFTVWF